MPIPYTLELEREGENTVVGRRYFAAPVEAVYAAHVEPELMRQWLLGPDGWRMEECIFEAQPGGKIHLSWENESDPNAGFYLTGEVLMVDKPNRLLHIERMHLPDPTPDNRVETLFTAEGEGTMLTIRMTLPDAESLEATLATGMAEGMEASYARLGGVFKDSLESQ